MIELREGDFSLEEVIEKLRSPKIGAIVTYIGVVRGFSEEGEVEGLKFDPEDEIATRKLEKIRKEALERFDIDDVAIIHRVGALKVCDNILGIAVSASHRDQAFDACKYIVDNIKDRVHITWKKESLKGKSNGS